MTREIPVQRRKPRGKEPGENSLLTRRRFQFAGALLFSALVPWLARPAVAG